MRILLVQPANTTDRNIINRIFKKIRITSFPPLTLPQVASLTPREHEVRIVDDNFEKIPYDGEFDLVGITARTCTAPRAYEIADEFRRRGVPVVMGGYHPSALPMEAKQHADSVVIGDAEDTWPKLLEDFVKGRLKSFYISNGNGEIPSPRRDLTSYISLTTTIQATRGCPIGCRFCALTNFPNGRRLRFRPVSDVVREIKDMGRKFLAFVDASISVCPDYFKSLFREMVKLNVKFSAFANVNIVQDETLLSLAKKAGCISLSIGFDSVSRRSLHEVNKDINKVKMYKNVVKKIHEHGMSVIGCFIFGFDGDTKDVFDATSDAISDIDPDCIRVNILTPLPGTPLFEKLEREGRILTRDWSKYNYQNVVFMPKNMSPEELLEGTKRVIRDFFSVSNMCRKIVYCLKRGVSYSEPIIPYIISSKIYHQNLIGWPPLIRRLGIREIQI